jgi:hypothetical protein
LSVHLRDSTGQLFCHGAIEYLAMSLVAFQL